MIIKNKSTNQEITVTDKDYQARLLKPGECCEVEDQEGKGYIANYSNILEKIDTKLTENEKEEKIITLEKRIARIEELMNLPKVDPINEADLPKD